MSVTDVELARQIATAAGELLITLQRSALLEGKALGVAGDRVANSLIVEALRDARPDDAILSEEEADNPARLTASRVWIIDPLDGTREFSEGRADWAVHVALAVDGHATIGAVALPGVLETLDSASVKPPAPRMGRPRLVVSRSRPAAETAAIAASLGGELLSMGSAGAKAMAVVQDRADIYLHSGGQYEWDNCAPVAVARAAGLHVSRLDGSPLIYNRSSTYLPDLLICRMEWADEVLALAKTVMKAC